MATRDTFPFYNLDLTKLYNADIGEDPVIENNFHLSIGNIGGRICIIIKEFIKETYLKFNKVIYLRDIIINGENVLDNFKPCINKTDKNIYNNIAITVGRSGNRISDYTFLISFVSNKNEIYLIEIDINGCILDYLNFSELNENPTDKFDSNKTAFSLIRSRNIINDKIYVYFLINGFKKNVDENFGTIYEEQLIIFKEKVQEYLEKSNEESASGSIIDDFKNKFQNDLISAINLFDSIYLSGNDYFYYLISTFEEYSERRSFVFDLYVDQFPNFLTELDNTLNTEIFSVFSLKFDPIINKLKEDLNVDGCDYKALLYYVEKELKELVTEDFINNQIDQDILSTRNTWRNYLSWHFNQMDLQGHWEPHTNLLKNNIKEILFDNIDLLINNLKTAMENSEKFYDYGGENLEILIETVKSEMGIDFDTEFLMNFFNEEISYSFNIETEKLLKEFSRKYSYILEIGKVNRDINRKIIDIEYYDSSLIYIEELWSNDFYLKWFLEVFKKDQLTQDLERCFPELKLSQAPEIKSNTFFVDKEYVYSGLLLDMGTFLNTSTLIANNYFGAFTLNYLNGQMIYTAGEPAEIYYTIYSKQNYTINDPEYSYYQGDQNSYKQIFNGNELNMVLPTKYSGSVPFGSYMNMVIKTPILTIGPFKFELAHEKREQGHSKGFYQIYRDWEKQAETVFM